MSWLLLVSRGLGLGLGCPWPGTRQLSHLGQSRTSEGLAGRSTVTMTRPRPAGTADGIREESAITRAPSGRPGAGAGPSSGTNPPPLPTRSRPHAGSVPHFARVRPPESAWARLLLPDPGAEPVTHGRGLPGGLAGGGKGVWPQIGGHVLSFPYSAECGEGSEPVPTPWKQWRARLGRPGCPPPRRGLSVALCPSLP